MASRLSAALLAAGVVLPTIPAVYEIPYIGPAATQAYNQLPDQVKRQIPEAIRAQIVPPGNAGAGQVNTVSDQAALEGLVREVNSRHAGWVAVSVAGGGAQLTAGDNRPIPAFSTMKVPTSIAALRQNLGFYPDAELAITQSDNAAQHRMEAAVPPQAVAGVIGEAGSATVNSTGWWMSTLWNTSQQAQFASGLRCVPGHEPVYDMMGRIVPWQHWGLGRIADAHFKGGWNSFEGGHLSRQFGLVPGPNGDIAVAITAYSPAGYEESTAMLSELADGIGAIRGTLPTSRC